MNELLVDSYTGGYYYSSTIKYLFHPRLEIGWTVYVYLDERFLNLTTNEDLSSLPRVSPGEVSDLTSVYHI